MVVIGKTILTHIPSSASNMSKPCAMSSELSTGGAGSGSAAEGVCRKWDPGREKRKNITFNLVNSTVLDYFLQSLIQSKY